MELSESTKQLVKDNTIQWIRQYGFCPVGAYVENWGIPGCHRNVVVLRGNGSDKFVDEEYRRKDAQALADQINKYIKRYF